ncbi:MAG: 4Fe-4S dicluster domain-containing protein, partial [Clostridia bacterium]|nr:4Fe-4S dicluster domain-containing protein [Clostridia bacterium]
PVALAALELDWVEALMFPYNIVETQGEEILELCKAKNVGFIDMKPLAGGAIEDARAAMRFVAKDSRVTVIIPGMAELSELDTNIAAVEDESEYSAEEAAKEEEIRRMLGNQFCRRCNYCAPCTVGINISGVFLFAGYLQRYGLGDWAKSRYATLDKKADDCIGCGVCETRCPYQLPIREMLKKAAEDFAK